MGTLEFWGASRQIEHHTFTVPDGFEIELVAGPPLVERPIVADFDDQGRLYVADSSGSNDKVQQQLAEKPHRIVRLEDTDGDGVFDESVVFADGLMFPEGVLWHKGAIYCGTPPEIWKLEDTDGDGVADKREVWFDAKTLTGCANDIHGPYLGKDGWIYWCKGAFAEQTHTLFNGRTIKDSAAHIFRCLPDGSEFDSVMSGGMDNPIEIAFDDAGEVFFNTTFYSHPRAGKRDALVHALYGGVYPKEHGVLDGLVLTGDYLPAMTHLGPAAPSGLTRYESAAFGKSFQGNLFSTQFNLRKVQRHQLVEVGASFRTEDSDFVVSSHHDFHPTDVLEAGDGSLLVVDTGGWYKLCCPTSQLYKPDVLGAIYRVRRTENKRVGDPYGNAIAWESLSPSDLIKLLEDDRHRVRGLAVQVLADKGQSALTDMKRAWDSAHDSTRLKQQILWSLTRMPLLEAREMARNGLQDDDVNVVRTAVHAVGVHHDGEALPILLKLLSHSDTHVRRKTAEAIGRIGSSDAASVLLSTANDLKDRAHEHAVIYALIQINPAISTLQAALNKARHPDIRRVALIVLSQMHDGGLTASDVAGLLSAENEALREAAIWVAGFHPEWGGELADHFVSVLKEQGGSAEDLFNTQRQLEIFVGQSSIQSSVAHLLKDSSTTLPVKQMLLKVMSHESLRQIPEVWLQSMADVMESESSNLLIHTIETVSQWTLSADKHSALLPALVTASLRGDLPLESQLALQKSISRFKPELSNPQMDVLLAAYRDEDANRLRDLVVDVWSDVSLNPGQLKEVLSVFEISGPLHLSRLVELYHGHVATDLGQAFMDTLRAAPAQVSVRPDLLLYAVDSFPSVIQDDARAWLKAMEVDVEGQRQHLDQTLASLPQGDIRRGQAVFKRDATACSACHQVGYVGGQTGPDLTRIGSVRTERDLLEAILFPSASFVRSYEPMIVETQDGEQYSGVMHRESGDELRMVIGAGNEIRLTQKEIDSIRPGQVSLMPSGLEEQLSPLELADLLVFLKSRQ